MSTSVVRVPVKDRSAVPMAIIAAAMIGAFAWIVTSALNGGTPSGSARQYLPASDPPTQTPWLVTSTPGSVTPLLVLVATAPPTPTAVPMPTITRIPNCEPGEAIKGQPCQGKPRPNVVTPVPMSTCQAEVPEYVQCIYQGG